MGSYNFVKQVGDTRPSVLRLLLDKHGVGLKIYLSFLNYKCALNHLP